MRPKNNIWHESDFTQAVETSGIVSSVSGGATTPTSYTQSGIMYGKIANICLTFNNGAVNATTGTNGTLTIQLTSDWYPAVPASGVGYWSTSSFIAQLDTSGSLKIRNASDTARTFSSSSPLVIALSYIIA